MSSSVRLRRRQRRGPAHVWPREVAHATPLVFDVESDPSEAFPLKGDELPPTLHAELRAAKANAEAHLQPTSISPAWGYEHALCCGIGCKKPCHCACKDVDLPPAAGSHGSGV